MVHDAVGVEIGAEAIDHFEDHVKGPGTVLDLFVEVVFVVTKVNQHILIHQDLGSVLAGVGDIGHEEVEVFTQVVDVVGLLVVVGLIQIDVGHGSNVLDQLVDDEDLIGVEALEEEGLIDILAGETAGAVDEDDTVTGSVPKPGHLTVDGNAETLLDLNITVVGGFLQDVAGLGLVNVKEAGPTLTDITALVGGKGEFLTLKAQIGGKIVTVDGVGHHGTGSFAVFSVVLAAGNKGRQKHGEHKNGKSQFFHKYSPNDRDF